MLTKEQKIWIVKNYSAENGISWLVRKLGTEFYRNNPASKPSYNEVKRVVQRFEKDGTVHDLRIKNSRPTMSGDSIKLVKNFFKKKPTASLRQASSSLDISTSSVHNTLRKTLKFKPYRARHVQSLSPEHKLKRQQACQRFLDQGEDWPNKIIFSDEKWFCLKPHPNKKNQVTWSITNPNNIEEVRDQGVKKVMAWVGFVNGKLLPIHWFEGSVNGNQYLEMLKNKVWPSVRGTATRDGLWFMQDGAKPHTTNDCLGFLQEKFQNRAVSNRLEFFLACKEPRLKST